MYAIVKATIRANATRAPRIMRPSLWLRVVFLSRSTKGGRALFRRSRCVIQFARLLQAKPASPGLDSTTQARRKGWSLSAKLRLLSYCWCDLEKSG